MIRTNEKVCQFLDGETGRCNFLVALTNAASLERVAGQLPVTELQPGEPGPAIDTRDLRSQSMRRFMCQVASSEIGQRRCAANTSQVQR